MAPPRPSIFVAPKVQHLTDDAILHLSPPELYAVSEQLDQKIVSVLQQIDAKFAEANLLVHTRILPAVQNYGEHSQQIWESVKFWKSFYEASANTRLSDPYTGDESVSSSPRPAHEHDASLVFPSDAGDASLDSNVARSEEGEGGATPRAAAVSRVQQQGTGQWTNDLSPFQVLQADLDHIKSTSVHPPTTTTTTATSASAASLSKQVHRLRLGDLPPDSPDLPLPSLETSILDDYGPSGSSRRAYAPSLPSPPSVRSLPVAHERLHPLLLQKLLHKNLASPTRPPPSPSAAAFPADLPRGFKGLTNLTSTSLASFPGPANSPSAAGGSGGGAPRLAYELPVVGYEKTPRKEAARKIARDVYETTVGGAGRERWEEEEEDPWADLEVPSAMKEWEKRGYGSGGGEGARKGFEEEMEENEEEERGGEDGMEYRVGTTGRIDELLKEAERGGYEGLIGDEEEGQEFVEEDEEEEEGEEDYEVEVGHPSLHDEHEHEVGGLEDLSDDQLDPTHFGGGNNRADGPEDTLFGMPKSRAIPKVGTQRAEEEVGVGEERAEAGNGKGGFRIFGAAEEMHTLRGGQLLESEPFEESPLAARTKKD